MSEADIYAPDVRDLIEFNGDQGQVEGKPLTGYAYDPATGETSSDAPMIDVLFVFLELRTMEDLDVHRRALQRDTGLDRFVQGRILFYPLTEAEMTESGSLTYDGKVYAFTDLHPFMVNGRPVAYQALHAGGM